MKSHESQTVLVTGGAGYIGSHACKALARAGYLPVTYDNLDRGHEAAVKWGPLVCGDLRDERRLRKAIQTHRPHAVLHFAALAYVGESVKNPSLYYSNNVNGTLTLLETMRNESVNHIVFSSTCATYGIPERVPIKESTRRAPINPYGHTKLIIEQMLADYREAYSIRSVALRYFNAAGADPDGEIGEDHDPETHLIPNALRVAAGLHNELEIFGADYPTPDGTCVRDYVHVSDLASAHVLALQKLTTGDPRPAYNLSNARGYSVLEVIRAAERITGTSISRRILPRRPGDPPELVGDSTLARTELGWIPEHSTMESIIETAWMKFRMQKKAGGPKTDSR